MIKKTIRQMLTAQIFSALTVSLCLLIDSIMIGRYLGVKALAAYGFANPLLLILGAFATMLSAGVQVVCSKSLGRGSQEDTNRGYSSAVIVGLMVAAVFLLIVVPLRSQLAGLLGAGGKEGAEQVIFDDTRNYILGFVIGAPAMMLALVLVPFLQMAGKSTLLIVSVLAMTVADVVFDLLNVLVFQWGMFGMGLASSLSYYVALIIAVFYFLSKKCVFRFSPKYVSGGKILELLRSGLPSVFAMASSVVIVFIMNRLLKNVGGSAAVAAFSVITTLGGSANCISTGVGGVSLTMSGIFYNEEDCGNLRSVTGLLCKYSVFLGIAMGAVLALASPLLVSLFIREAGTAKEYATLGVRLFGLGLIPCALNNTLKSYYQGTEKAYLTAIISIAESAFFPAIVAYILSVPFGTTGAWLYFALGELIALIALGVFILIRTKKLPWQDGAFLLLPEGFSVPAGDLLESDIYTEEDAVRVAEQAGRFCRNKGGDAVSANRIALCVEEMAVNVVQHGFTKDDKPHQLSIRLLSKPDSWILRFRDNCRAFDPITYVPREGKDALGIQLAIALADDSRYTYSLNMNNLTMILGKQALAEGRKAK